MCALDEEIEDCNIEALTDIHHKGAEYTYQVYCPYYNLHIVL